MVCFLANKYCMKISLCITNHNQHELVYQTIEAIKAQTVQPDFIYVCSDDKSFLSNEPNVICINNKVLKGRCQNRNSVIKNFLNSSSDALVFIDGDTCPKNTNFIEKYEDCFKNYDLVFGTREHTNPIGLKKPPSDLLTANMDNLWNNKPLSYEDLRVASNAVNTWQNSYKFYEKLDLMVTGMIGWSCNFGFTKEGLKKHLEFMKNTYGDAELFDSKAFKGNWGYEDVAMGIDALFAGLNIWITNDIKIVHKSHERTDGLFDHVAGRHLIMERVRKLEQKRNKEKPNRQIKSKIGFFLIGLIIGIVLL